MRQLRLAYLKDFGESPTRVVMGPVEYMDLGADTRALMGWEGQGFQRILGMDIIVESVSGMTVGK